VEAVCPQNGSLFTGKKGKKNLRDRLSSGKVNNINTNKEKKIKN
jgi:hypothetical protein